MVWYPRCMTKQTTKLTVIALIASIVFWSLLVYFVGADRLVELIGVKNGYVIVFVMALFGGMSSFSGISYPATIVTLASGGLDPLSLAIFSAAGVLIGDTVYFYISHHSSRLVGEGSVKALINRFSAWLNRRPRWVVFLVVYLYTALTPLPNDLLTISLGLARQPYALVITALAFGSLTFTYTLAYFGHSLF